MKIVVVGRRTPASEGVLRRALREMQCTAVCAVGRTGLAKIAEQEAKALGIPFVSYWPDRYRLGSEAAYPVAVQQLVSVEKPDIAIAMMTSETDDRVVRLLVEMGVRTFIGTFDCRRKVSWSLQSHAPSATSPTVGSV